MDHSSRHLLFTQKNRVVGTFTFSNEYAEKINWIAVKNNLPVDSNFSDVVRFLIDKAAKAQPPSPAPAPQPQPPAPQPIPEPPVKPEPKPPVLSLPRDMILIKIENKDIQCFKVRRRKGSSQNIGEMYRQAINYLRKDPSGSIFTGSW